MSAYFIARVNITDRNQYREYLSAVPGIISKYSGRVLARTEEPLTLEGPEENRRIILIEFPSPERAKEFYNSDEYRAARELRQYAAEGEIIVVESII